MRICSQGHTECPSETEVGNLENLFRVNEQVLRLEVSVHDAFCMKKHES